MVQEPLQEQILYKIKLKKQDKLGPLYAAKLNFLDIITTKLIR